MFRLPLTIAAEISINEKRGTSGPISKSELTDCPVPLVSCMRLLDSLTSLY